MTDPEDDPKIGLEDLNRRFKALTYEFYSQMVFLMKGAVLTVAASAIMGILQGDDGLEERLLFFFAMHQQSVLWARMKDLSRKATS